MKNFVEEVTDIPTGRLRALGRILIVPKTTVETEVTLVEVTLKCDSVSVTKSKCGFGEFTGFISSPPKKYLTQTVSGVSQYCTYNPPGTLASCAGAPASVKLEFHGSRVCNPSTCVLSGQLYWDESQSYTNCGGSDSGFSPNIPFTVGSGGGSAGSTLTNIVSATLVTADIQPNMCGYNQQEVLTGQCELLDEYTTALLKTTTASALPAFDNDFNDSCAAVHDLAEDENSFTLHRFKYKFELASVQAEDVTVNWVERFTPTVGSVVDTPRNGVITAGLLESNVFTCPDPTSNGSTGIADIVAFIP